MAEWRIETLSQGHGRAAFSYGRPATDDFIRRLVSQYERRNLGRTYVAGRPGDATVRGYYTLASGAVAFEKLPAPAAKKLPRHPVPVVLLARLAVDQSVQGQALGEALLIDSLHRCLGLADALGIHAVEVHAIDQSARAFYEKYGFVPLLDSELHLFLPFATIKTVFSAK